MTRTALSLGLAAAAWLAGPAVVLEAAAAGRPVPWPTASVAVAAGGFAVVALAVRSGVVRVERLWSHRAVRVTLTVASLFTAVGFTTSEPSGSAVDGELAAMLGVSLLVGGGVVIWQVLGRANRRRIESATEVAALGSRTNDLGPWFRVFFLGLAAVSFGQVGAEMLSGSGVDSATPFVRGVGFGLVGAIGPSRSWSVTERGLVGGFVEFPWASVGAVRIDGGAVTVRFASRLEGWQVAGIGRSLRFSREEADARAVELLASHADVDERPRRHRAPGD